MVINPQKLTFLLYVAAGCTLCKAGFTQLDFISIGIMWNGVCGFFGHLGNEMEGTTAKSSDTYIVMFLSMYHLPVA